MSDTPRKTFTDVYDSAVLSSFSDKELSFIDKVQSANEVINPNVIGDFKFTTPVYDSNGNITDFSVSGLPGVDSNGKPTEETTNWLIEKIDDFTLTNPRATSIKLPNGNEISMSEATTIIRARHGMASAEKVGPSGSPANYFSWGSRTSPTNFSSSKFREYTKSQIVARKCTVEINRMTDEFEELKKRGVLISTMEETLITTPSGNKQSVGVNEVYVYAPGQPNSGKTYDFSTPLMKILENEGVSPGTPEATLVGKEVDHLVSGFKTRTADGGTRVDSNGNVTGGPTSDAARTIIPVVDESTGDVKKDKDGNIVYTVTNWVGSTKKGASGIVFSGIIAHQFHHAISHLPIIGRPLGAFADFLSHAEHWIVGNEPLGGNRLPIGNKLIWLKMAYGLLQVAKGTADAYNNPLTPAVIHAMIHFLTKRLEGAGARAAFGFGWGNLLEIIWIGGEFTWTFAIKPSIDAEAERRERNERNNRLWQEALSLNCFPPRYVESGGTACIRCESTVKWDPILQKKIPYVSYDPKNSGILLPIGVERDKKTGEIIYEKDPTDPSGLRKIPKYIYPKREIPQVSNPDGKVKQDAQRIIDSNRPGIIREGGRTIFVVPNQRDATSVQILKGPCFDKDTPISTPIGFKKIHELKVGDEVLSFDEKNNIETDIVSEIFVHENSELFSYSLSNGKTIYATENHPVLVNGKEFKPISEVSVNDYLTDENGENVFINSSVYDRTDFSYNIEVQKNHTYIANGILVHNKNVVTFDVPNEALNDGQGTSTYVGVIPTHTAGDEDEYNSYINAAYKNSITAESTKNLMIVSANANNVQHSSMNAGPLYGAINGSIGQSDNSATAALDELRKIKERDRILSEKDAYWLSLMYESGIIQSDGTGAKGGGTAPPIPPDDQGEQPTSTIPTDRPFTIDLGTDILYFVGGWAVIIPKYPKPSKQYSPDGITACFPEWVEVKCLEGQTMIKNVKIGDIVYTYNDEGNLELSTVTDVKFHNDKTYYVNRYTLDNETSVDMTPNHVVLTEKMVYKRASDLIVGEKLVSSSGKIVTVISIEHLGNYFVYNLTVDKNENYIVNDIVVSDR